MMNLKTADAVHRSALYKILTAIADDAALSRGLIFKGGTCAVLLGWLDRFSVDLDFDLGPTLSRSDANHALELVFDQLSLPVAQKHPTVLMYKVTYSNSPTARKTIKVSVNDELVAASKVAPQYLADIDRMMICQTRDTMVAHKMIALVERYTKKRQIAGRDLYDIHEFFLNGYGYDESVLRERMKLSARQYVAKMIGFIEEHVTQQVIDEDLNLLLPQKPFQAIRKTFKQETLMLLRTELARLEKSP